MNQKFDKALAGRKAILEYLEIGMNHEEFTSTITRELKAEKGI